MNALHRYYVLYVDSLHDREVFNEQEVIDLKAIFDKEFSGMGEDWVIILLRDLYNGDVASDCYFCNICASDCWKSCLVKKFCDRFKWKLRSKKEYGSDKIIKFEIMKAVLDEYTD